MRRLESMVGKAWLAEPFTFKNNEMSKQIKIERITCHCGEVIAGCVHGQQDTRWNKDLLAHLEDGCKSDIVLVEDFKFGKCQCEDGKRKMRFKVLAENEPAATLFAP